MHQDKTMREALERQWAENGRLYFRLAWNVVRNQAAAEDVCQQALLAAWRERAGLRDGQALRAWVCRIVVREALVCVRRRRVEQRALAQRTPPEAAPPDEDAGERRAAVLAAIEKLPEAVRAVVVLRLLDGRSGLEVVDLLGMSPAEVSRRLHRGMDLLRASLVDWRDSVGS